MGSRSRLGGLMRPCTWLTLNVTPQCTIETYTRHGHMEVGATKTPAGARENRQNRLWWGETFIHFAFSFFFFHLFWWLLFNHI